MSVRKTGLATIPEGSTAEINGILKDEKGVVIKGSSLTLFTLTLYVKGFPDKILNSRNAQSIKNTNGGAIDESGNFTMTLSSLDNAIIDDNNDTEEHIALFKWEWDSGNKKGRKEVLLEIDNLDKEP